MLIYTQVDWKNQNYQTEISDSDKQLLSELDNSENNIYLPSIDAFRTLKTRYYTKKRYYNCGISHNFINILIT